MASRLRLEADRIESRARAVAGRVRTLDFRGPKADRFVDSIARNVATAHDISGVLISTSNTLLRAAATVEIQQHEWQLRRARMLEEQA
jgi:hypothetical protein